MRQWIGLWLLAVNAAGFLLMGADKRRAILRAQRVPERVFLLLSVLGGAAGVLAGMVSFRHKTKHGKFALGVPAILLAQILLGFWLLARG